MRDETVLLGSSRPQEAGLVTPKRPMAAKVDRLFLACGSPDFRAILEMDRKPEEARPPTLEALTLGAASESAYLRPRISRLDCGLAATKRDASRGQG